MHTIAKLGLAAALLVGGANAVIAQDADVDVGVDAGIDAGVDDGMEAGAAGSVGVDATTTGSIGAEDRNYASVISSMQTGTSADVAAFNESSSVNCVSISSLEGAAEGTATLDSALSSNQDDLLSLHSNIEGNAELMSELEASCSASIDDFEIQDVIWVESGADGSFTFYVDDRA